MKAIAVGVIIGTLANHWWSAVAAFAYWCSVDFLDSYLDD